MIKAIAGTTESEKSATLTESGSQPSISKFAARAWQVYLYFILFALIPYTLYLIPYTLHLIPYTLYLIPYTLYLIPYTLYFTLYTLMPYTV